MQPGGVQGSAGSLAAGTGRTGGRAVNGAVASLQPASEMTCPLPSQPAPSIPSQCRGIGTSSPDHIGARRALRLAAPAIVAEYN